MGRVKREEEKRASLSKEIAYLRDHSEKRQKKDAAFERKVARAKNFLANDKRMMAKEKAAKTLVKASVSAHSTDYKKEQAAAKKISDKAARLVGTTRHVKTAHATVLSARILRTKARTATLAAGKPVPKWLAGHLGLEGAAVKLG